MVTNVRSHGRADLRKTPRRSFQYKARIITDASAPPRVCAISDISENGARLVLQSEADLPEHFVLLLTKEGSARRKCRLVWRDGTAVGVEFTHVRP
jgi:hypothetical protein